MHEGKLIFLRSDIRTFPHSVDRSGDGTNFFLSTSAHWVVWEIQPIIHTRQMVKGHVRLAKFGRCIDHEEGFLIWEISHYCVRCSIMEHISLYPFELFVTQLCLWQCPDAFDALGIKDVCIKAGAVPFANVLANHRENWRLCGRSFMQISFILIWKNKMNSAS